MKSSYLILGFLCVANAAPVSQLAPKEMVDFMKQYGYLIDAGPNTDALYTKEAFKDAVRQMQRFGGVPETGIIDEKTLELLTSPRCGVKDVVHPSLLSNRTKRYIIGAEGWKKRTITYFLANWPQELSQETIMEKTKKAFEVWSRISNLRFVHVNSTSADIIIAFGQGAHGDGYPFDGSGNILAHAFFPYEHGSYGGDAHFDTDEVWMDGSKDRHNDASVCCDYYTVAVHELGHSLGLAHSQVPGSIMFPYYKGYDPNFSLDYDDMLGMYQMYVANGVFEDEVATTTETPRTITTPFSDITTQRSSTNDHGFSDYNDDDGFSSTTVQDYPNYPSVKPPEEDDEEDVPNEEDEEKIPDERRTSSEEDGKKEIPDKDEKPKEDDKPHFVSCNGSYDAISLLRNELFIFKGPYMWRLSDRAVMLPTYPVYFRLFLPRFPWSVQKIDAVYERKTDYKMLFFTEKQYWLFDGSSFSDESPFPLTQLGLPAHLESIDAAIVWGKNKRTYFFSGNYYWRYNEVNATMDEGYPHPIQRWRGVPAKLNSAFTWRDGQTYFFKGNEYWRFNNGDIMVDDNFPQSASEHWLGCADTSGKNCFNC